MLAALLLSCGGGEAPAPPPEPAAVKPAAEESSPEEPSPEAPAPDVLIVAIDGLRADALAPDSAPRLAAWAADARRWTRAQASAPWALPSLASLLTGQPVHRHGVGRDPVRSSAGETCLVGLDPDAATLGQALQARGYATAAFGLSETARAAGLERGFPGGPVAAVQAGAHVDRVVADTAASWLRAQDGPAAAVVHLHGPLPPLAPPAPFAGTRAADLPADGEPAWAAWAAGARPSPAWVRRARALYLEEVAAVDAAVGGLLDAVDPDDTWIVVVGTSGLDLWGEGALGTGHALTAGLTHVPLLVDGPGVASGEEADVVGLDAVLPALLDALDTGTLALGDARDGAALLGGLRTGPVVEGRVDGQLRIVRNPATGVVETWRVTASGEEVPGGPAERALVPRALTRLEVETLEPADVGARPCLE